MIKGTCTFALSVLVALVARGEDNQFLEEQALRFEEKLSTAIEELKELNTLVAKEKAPLLETVNADRLKVAVMRNEIETALFSKAKLRRELEELGSEVDERSEHVNYADSLLGEFIGDLEAGLSVSEDQLYSEEIREFRLSVGSELTEVTEEKVIGQFDVLDLAVGRLEQLLGGTQFTGKAVGTGGELLEGDFLLLGPSALFISQDRSELGAAVGETNLSEPILVETPGLDSANFAKVVEGGEGVITLDASMGKALGIQSARWSFKEHVTKGGYVGYAIIAFAGVSVLVALLKILQLAGRGRTPFRDADRILELLSAGKVDSAMDESDKLSEPYRSILRLTLKNRDEEDEVLDEVVLGQLQRERTRLERKLPLLALIAATTPLMGLLGTVVGMIKTFALITVFGSGEAKSLSSGISEALVTTEFGLLVAIPTLLLHGLLNRLSKERISELEEFAADFVVGLRKSKSKANRKELSA